MLCLHNSNKTHDQSLDDDVYVWLLWFCCGFVLVTNIVRLWISTSSSKDWEQWSKNNQVFKCDEGIRKIFEILADGNLFHASLTTSCFPFVKLKFIIVVLIIIDQQVCSISIIKSIWRDARGVMHEVRVSRLVLRIATWVTSVVIELWAHYDWQVWDVQVEPQWKPYWSWARKNDYYII